jgi:hypothetical protein
MPIGVSNPSGPSPLALARSNVQRREKRDTRLQVCPLLLFVEPEESSKESTFKQELSHLLGALLKSAP